MIGTRGAMEVYGKLLQEGLKVYVPLTYTGYDCIVKSDAGKHIDIEIKTRTEGGQNFIVDNFENRDDFFIICHILSSEDYWVLPSFIYAKNSTSQKGGQLLVLSNTKKKVLNEYDRAFFLLRDFGKNSRVKDIKAPVKRQKSLN
jgi:hypothetical protein